MNRSSLSPRLLRRSPRSRPLALALPIALACAGPLALALAAGGQPAQTGTGLLLPDLQVADPPAPRSGSLGLLDGTGPRGMAGLAGQEGFGETQVAVQNVAGSTNSVQLDLVPKSSADPATLKGSAGARKALLMNLQATASLSAGFFAGRLSGSQALGATARLRWSSGAGVAYEAQPASKELILPLVARTVYSHTTLVAIQNPYPGPGRNEITMTLFDRDDGSILNEAVFDAGPGETASWDTANMPNTFGETKLGSNAPTHGWLGSALFEAKQPIAVLGYGDELEGRGSSAYVARPVADADTVQYLPLLRANYHGDSLIAVANAGKKAVDVTIRYRGAGFSPSGAGQDFSQSFQIAPRGSAFVDLSSRQRGSRPAPALPRGSGADRGFVGSAVVEASGPVLAVAQDEQLKSGIVDSVSAYNAFGTHDLGTEWGAPTVRKASGFLSTALVFQNPGASAASVTVDLMGATDQAAGQATVEVPAGGQAWLRLTDVAAFPAGVEGRAMIRATSPIAALVYDERDTTGDPNIGVREVPIADWSGLGIAGSAKLTEKGNDVEVAISLTGTAPGTSYPAQIRAGACPPPPEVTHTLSNVVGGKSTTTLPGISIAGLTLRPHAIVIQAPPAMPGLPIVDAACGHIKDTQPSADTIDTDLAAAVRLTAGTVVTPPAPTTPAPTGTATPTGVRPSDTPTSTPVGPTPSPSATATGTDVKVKVYLPWTFAKK